MKKIKIFFIFHTNSIESLSNTDLFRIITFWHIDFSLCAFIINYINYVSAFNVLCCYIVMRGRFIYLEGILYSLGFRGEFWEMINNENKTFLFLVLFLCCFCFLPNFVYFCLGCTIHSWKTITSLILRLLTQFWFNFDKLTT
jgi:hypothetical protein